MRMMEEKSMGITIRVCPQCGERHAVQRNGSMSIHTTKWGERCAPPERTERSYGTGYDPSFRIVTQMVGGGHPGLGRRR
ncbi:hypothetical protein GCM10011490_24080 [Pseudoclavibacter endophyticus]|nr:hypothetical protein GCM10011490_24080 [Pseudoclavibacter endophyticus]